MPFILIKNYMKLILRNKWMLLLMTLLPVIIIALLSNVFKDMLDTSHTIEEFKVGYSINDNSIYSQMLPELKSVCEENDIELFEYPEEDISKLIMNGTVAAFVDISDASFTIYQAGDKKIEAAVTESIFSSFFYQVNETMTLITYSMEHGNTEIKKIINAQVTNEKLDTDPVPSSIDYYGIVYIVYGTWCGLVILVSVISSERKGAVLRRMRVSQMSNWKCYIGKFIPGALAIFIEVCIAWALTTLLFDIHWGNITTSVLIIFLTSMAAAAFGIVLFHLFNNVAIGIVLGFTTVWMAGFLGGSFQTYMYTFLPQKLVEISPLYYIDRTLIEFSTKGHSNYTGACILYLIAIIVVCSTVGTLLMRRKSEEQ